MTDYHIRNVLGLELVDTEAIRKANFSVAIDCVNSVGGIAIPRLLHELGVTDITCLNCDPTGDFAHNPEPLRENLTEISDYIASHKVDVGFVVDPDVDRLAIVCEDGEMFGEEYTLVSVADYILSHIQGNTVSNLSSTRALADITAHYGGQYAAAAVGEVNEGYRSHHRGRRQRGRYLPCFALRTRCFGRDSSIPYIACKKGYEGIGSAKNVSRVFYLEKQDRAHTADRCR